MEYSVGRVPGDHTSGTSKDGLPGFAHVSKGFGLLQRAGVGGRDNPDFQTDGNVYCLYQPTPSSAMMTCYGSGWVWNFTDPTMENLMATFGYVMPSSKFHVHDGFIPSEVGVWGDVHDTMTKTQPVSGAGPNAEEPTHNFRLSTEASLFIPAVVFRQVQEAQRYAEAATDADAAGGMDPALLRYIYPTWNSRPNESLTSDDIDTDSDIAEETYYIGCMLQEHDSVACPLTASQIRFVPKAYSKVEQNPKDAPLVQEEFKPDAIVYWREGDEPLIVTNPEDEMDDHTQTFVPEIYPTANNYTPFNNFSPFKHDMLWSIPSYPSSTGSYEMESSEYSNTTPSSSPSLNSDNCSSGCCNCHSVNFASPNLSSCNEQEMPWSAAAQEMWTKAKAANYQYLYASGGLHSPVSTSNPNYFKRYIMCPFCKRNGKPACMYNSHTLYNKDNIVTCPILRRYICSLCGASGDTAHTLAYCPLNRK